MKPAKATARAHPNIALVKYWGKRDAERILPHQSSFSVTLAPLEVTTTVEFGGAETTVVLNGEPASGKERSRGCWRSSSGCAREAGTREGRQVVSRGNFPMAAGLASQRRGLRRAGAWPRGPRRGCPDDVARTSRLARTGSGSACRSVQGGVCIWHAGTRADGEDSFATQAFPEGHWPELRLLVCVVSREEKEVVPRRDAARPWRPRPTTRPG